MVYRQGFPSMHTNKGYDTKIRGKQRSSRPYIKFVITNQDPVKIYEEYCENACYVLSKLKYNILIKQHEQIELSFVQYPTDLAPSHFICKKDRNITFPVEKNS